MLVLGMLFVLLVAGPLLVLGLLALANSARAMDWLGGVKRRLRPPLASPPLNEDSPSTSQRARLPRGMKRWRPDRPLGATRL